MTFSINLKYQYGERVKDHINTLSIILFKQVKLTNTIQELRGKFGIDIIKSGGEL